MINYILFGILIFFSFVNLLISIGISNFLIKFLQFKINFDDAKNDVKIGGDQKGLMDINLVGTYDERFKK